MKHAIHRSRILKGMCCSKRRILQRGNLPSPLRITTCLKSASWPLLQVRVYVNLVVKCIMMYWSSCVDFWLSNGLALIPSKTGRVLGFLVRSPPLACTCNSHIGPVETAKYWLGSQGIIVTGFEIPSTYHTDHQGHKKKSYKADWFPTRPDSVASGL